MPGPCLPIDSEHADSKQTVICKFDETRSPIDPLGADLAYFKHSEDQIN